MFILPVTPFERIIKIVYSESDMFIIAMRLYIIVLNYLHELYYRLHVYCLTLLFELVRSVDVFRGFVEG